MPTIPFLDLKREHKKYLEELQQTVLLAVDSGWYVLGERKKRFEEEFARYCNVKHCVGVGNGLDAIHLILSAYKKLGKLKDGDEVIVPANGFIATALAVSQSGLIPVLADCKSDTYNIDPESVEKKVTRKTRAIIAVHLYGQIAAMKELQEIASHYSLLLIEDAAQAHGALYNGERAGSLANAAAFSFYPVKNLAALGDGGAVTTNNEKLAKMVRILSNYGSDEKYIHKYKGINSRLDEIQAAVLSLNLTYLDQDNGRRQQIAKIYSSEIKNPKITLPRMKEMASHVYHLYVIRTEERDKLQIQLEEKNIQTQIHYPLAIHKQLAYAELRECELPIAEKMQHEVLSIPLYPSLTDEEIARIVDALNNW